jgi:hypothetical protein
VLAIVAEWFYATLMWLRLWDNWTNDVYDALQYINHLLAHPYFLRVSGFENQ